MMYPELTKIETCRVTGEIALDDQNIYDPSVDVVQLRARVGMVFQKPNPFPKSIYENVAYGPRIHGLARTKEEQTRGLMFRTSLPADGGMLFPFPKPRIASFWMKNTLIPLDMFFIRADGSIANIAANTVPYSEEPVPSDGPVAAVLEIAGGRSAELGIKPGDKVEW